MWLNGVGYSGRRWFRIAWDWKGVFLDDKKIFRYCNHPIKSETQAVTEILKYSLLRSCCTCYWLSFISTHIPSTLHNTQRSYPGVFILNVYQYTIFPNPISQGNLWQKQMTLLKHNVSHGALASPWDLFPGLPHISHVTICNLLLSLFPYSVLENKWYSHIAGLNSSSSKHLWYWVNSVPHICLHFLICKIELIVPSLMGFWGN